MYVASTLEPADDLDCGAPNRTDPSGTRELRLASVLERSHQQHLALDHEPTR